MTVITNDYEAYRFIKNHLLTQGEKAINTGEDCQYRGYKEATLDRVKEESGFYSLDYDDQAYELFYDLLAETKPDAMCAVGCLILDKFYDQNFEGRVLENDTEILEAVKKSNPVWKITENSYTMLRILQSIHDGKMTHEWPMYLENIELSFNKYGDYKFPVTEGVE